MLNRLLFTSKNCRCDVNPVTKVTIEFDSSAFFDQLTNKMLTAEEAINLLFESDSALSGSDSGGDEGQEIYGYSGSAVSPHSLREEARLEGFISGK